MFGTTLMFAGFTRIIEVCFFVPSYATTSDLAEDDDTSEHTLADGTAGLSRGVSAKTAAARSWRHLTPFVSRFVLLNTSILTLSL